MADKMLIDLPQLSNSENLSAIISLIPKRVSTLLSLITSFRVMYNAHIKWKPHESLDKSYARQMLKNPRILSPLAPVCIRNEAKITEQFRPTKRIAEELLQRLGQEWKCTYQHFLHFCK